MPDCSSTTCPVACVQALLPPNAPHDSRADPPTPGGANIDPDNPCADSASGDTFGRFNNVDIAYNLQLGTHPGAPRADVAVVSDRGCDRVRFFQIDPSTSRRSTHGHHVARCAARLPHALRQPSLVQPSGAVEGWPANPLDDQNTVYGLTVAQGKPTRSSSPSANAVSCGTCESAAPRRQAHLSDRRARSCFDTSFDLEDEQGAPYSWTPCREARSEEPQSEGLVFDTVNDTLYVAFETIGLYKICRSRSRCRRFVKVGRRGG